MNYTKGTKIRFILSSGPGRIPNYDYDGTIKGTDGTKMNGKGSILFKANEGTIEDTYDKGLLVSYLDEKGKKLILGFKPEVLEPLETITNNYELF